MGTHTPAGRQSLAAIDARVYAMSTRDREQWYAEHPVASFADSPEAMTPEQRLERARWMLGFLVARDAWIGAPFWDALPDHVRAAFIDMAAHIESGTWQ